MAVVEYRQAVDDGNGNVLYAQVQAANRRGLNYLAEILCMIVAHFHDSDNPDHVAAQAPYLAALMAHDGQARDDWRYRRARGGGADDDTAVDDTAPEVPTDLPPDWPADDSDHGPDEEPGETEQGPEGEFRTSVAPRPGLGVGTDERAEFNRAG